MCRAPRALVVIATAPGKLILTGEYAVLDGAPALVIAVDRRVVARRERSVPSSPFLLAVARELAQRYGADSPGALAALEIAVDSSAFYASSDCTQKLGLGSSAAVTVAAAALALAAHHGTLEGHRDEVLAIALAAHANAQGAKGARGSGADVAAAVFGGAIAFTMPPPAGVDPDEASVRDPDESVRDPDESVRDPDDSVRGSDDGDRNADEHGRAHLASAAAAPLPLVVRHRWPTDVVLIPFFTGVSADTATLVSQIAVARTADPVAVGAALTAIAEASRAACASLADPPELAGPGLIAALRLAADATDQLAHATGVGLVPPCVTAARSALQALGGTAKTTGAGGGDVAIAVIPRSADVTIATRSLIEAGCQPLHLTLDDSGVDTRPAAQ
jgi:phosphomevalonate kinase